MDLKDKIILIGSGEDAECAKVIAELAKRGAMVKIVADKDETIQMMKENKLELQAIPLIELPQIQKSGKERRRERRAKNRLTNL